MRIYTVEGPDGRIYEVEGPEGATNAQVLAAVRRQIATQPPAPQPQSGFGPAFRAGIQGLMGAGAALAGRTGLMDQEAAQKEYEARQQRAKEIFKPTEQGWTEAPVTKFLELLGGSAPYMAAPLAAGLGAAALPLTGTAAAVAGLGAAGLTSAGQFTATNLSRQMEEGKKLAETDLGAAALAAVPQAALDTLSMRMIPGIGRIFGQAGVKITAENAKEIAEQGLKKTLIDYTAKTGKTAGIEGLTESAQQVLERLQAGLNITDEKARQEYFDSFLGGAVLGGTLAPAGRFVERGREQREARGLLEGQAAEERKTAQAAEEAKKKDPAYALQLGTDYQAAVERMKELQAAVPKRPAKDALPEEQMAYKAAVEARNTHLKDVLQPLAAEYVPRKAEITQLKQRQRIEGMTPLEYQMEQAGVDLTAPPKEERVFTGEEEVTQPPALAPEATYAQQQMALAQQQDLGTFEAADFAKYLMQDPAMAQRLVETKTAIPGVSKKESDAILGGLKLQLQERDKQARAATQAELQQRQADLKAQQAPEEADPLAMWKSSVEQTEEQATEELLRPNFETLRPTGPATVAVAPGITPMQNPTTLLNRLDSLVVARDKAAAEADSAFTSGNKEVGIKKSQEREAAQTALNNLEQMEGAPRALMSLRKAQDTALMNAAQLIDDLKVGRTLGGPEAATASSTPQTLINQINKQRDAFITSAVQEAAATRRLFAKALTQEEATQAANQIREVFNEWVTRSMAQPRSAALEERVVAPAQMRGTEIVRGAETEMVDPRPLEERRFGAYRAATQVLQEQLQDIAAKLKQVPRAPQRVEPTLKMQFPETEAAKTAEAKGETAQTLEGQLRRRRDYAQGLIDQAFQTRKVPGIAETLLTRAQDFLPSAPNTLLDAVENVADRIVRGQTLERSDLIALRDEVRAASARLGEAEVAGERVGQRELFPAEERRALAPKEERGALGAIREKPAVFQAMQAKESAKAKRAAAATQRSEQLTQDIRKELDRIDKERQAALEQRVEERRGSLQSAWQSAVKKAKNLVLSARKAAQKPQIDALKKEIDAIRKGGIEGLNKDTIDRLLAARAELDKLSGEFDTVVDAAEFLPIAQANKWVAYERGALEQAEKALADARTPQTVSAVQQQKAALQRAEQSRLQSLKGEEKAAEAARMRAAQTGLGLPGQRRVEGRVERIEPEQTAAQRAAEAEEARTQAREESAQRAEEREAERTALEQRVLDLGTQVAEREAAQQRARTPESKAKIQTEIDALTKDATLAQGQLDALGETKPRKKGPATVATGAALAKQKPLRTGYRKTLEAASEGMRRERERDVEIPGVFEFGPQEKLFPRETGPAYETRESTALSAEARDAVEDGDIRTALADLSKNGSTEFVRTLAKRLGDMTMRTKLEVKDQLTHKGEQVEGLYNSDKNLVQLHRDALSEEALTHELTHAATMRALEADPQTLTPEQRAARQEIERLHAAIQKQPDFAREYGRKDVKEFVSELMSNPAFRDKLDAQKPGFLKRIYNAFLRLLGMPRMSESAKAVENAYKLFMPSQALQAAPAPSARRGAAPGMATANRVADNLIAKERGWVQNLKDNFLGMGFRAQFVDKLAPVEEAFKKGGIDTTKALQAMYYLRMYDQRMHFTSQAISDGVPEIVEKARKDGGTERLIETKPGANISQVVDILKKKDVVKAAGSADGANRLFTLYLAAIRAERVGMDALNFGGTVTEADLKAARAEIEANDTLKNAFDEARDIYNQYNRNLIEFAVQTGALAKSEAKALLASNDYIPYYRVRDGVAQLIVGKEPPIRIGNLKDSPHLKELVGGDEAIFDFLTSSVQNTAMLLDMSMKNLATKNAMFELRDVGLATVSKVPKSGKTPEGAVTFKRDGEDHFAVVDTDTLGIDSDLLVKGLAGIPTMFPSFVRVLGIPARFLRRVVVASPVYMARQLFRDSLAASMTSGADLVPVLDSLKQIGKPKALGARGITGGQVFTGMPEDVTRMLKDMQAGKVSVTSGLAWLEAKSAQADALTREAQYQSYLKQGLSEMEATYMALESMNFSKRGLSPTMHMVSTLIPFFNAQIQGLDVLYKAFTGQMPMNERLAIREKLWTRGMLLAGMSVAYAMAMQDEEAYKNARPEEKYGNWFVKVPGFDESLRLPIPFELGYVFKALPEAVVNILSNEEGGTEAMKAGKHIVQQMVPGLSNYFLPQAVKPALETILGTSLYTGRSIESSREQMVEPGFRYRDNTTELAKEVGELTGFSPVKMEYLIRGYTGGMGMALLAALSAPFGSSGPEAATKRLSDLPVLGTLFQPKDAAGIIDATYERMKQVNQVKETYEDLMNKGRTADAQKYIATRMDDMVLASVAGSFREYMGQITEFERNVRASNMTPEQKREKLDQARQMKIQLATSVRAVAERTKPQPAPV